MKFKSLIGKSIGRLTVISLDSPHIMPSGKRVRYICLCSCGKTTSVLSGNLIAPKPVLSCGCLRDESVVSRNTKHNGCKKKLHTTWTNMKQRCYNKNNKNYSHYGARGIKVCNEWHTYISFEMWAQTSGYKDGLSIERIDVNSHYCPDNCTWIEKSEQVNNRRCTLRVTINGITKTVTQWSVHFGVSESKMYRAYASKIKEGVTLSGKDFIDGAVDKRFK